MFGFYTEKSGLSINTCGLFKNHKTFMCINSFTASMGIEYGCGIKLRFPNTVCPKGEPIKLTRIQMCSEYKFS